MPRASALPAPLPHESAAYSGDMLDSLRKMARQQGQILLAHILALAVVKARALAGQESDSSGEPAEKRNFQAQHTRLPG